MVRLHGDEIFGPHVQKTVRKITIFISKKWLGTPNSASRGGAIMVQHIIILLAQRAAKAADCGRNQNAANLAAGLPILRESLLQGD